MGRLERCLFVVLAGANFSAHARASGHPVLVSKILDPRVRGDERVGKLDLCLSGVIAGLDPARRPGNVTEMTIRASLIAALLFAALVAPTHAADAAFRQFLQSTWPEAQQLGVVACHVRQCHAQS